MPKRGASEISSTPPASGPHAQPTATSSKRLCTGAPSSLTPEQLQGCDLSLNHAKARQGIAQRMAEDNSRRSMSSPSTSVDKSASFSYPTESPTPLEEDLVGIVLATRHRNSDIKRTFFPLLCTRQATFADLDDFVRRKWLGYEHTSFFLRAHEWEHAHTLPIEPGHFCGGSFNLDARLCSLLRLKEEVGYVYDLASPTELMFTVRERRFDEAMPVPSEPISELRGPEGEADKFCRDIANEAGEADEEWPWLSKALRMQATLIVGQPMKKGNPNITRKSPFYCTIYDQGGELNSGPVTTGAFKPQEVGRVFDKVEQVTEAHFSGNAADAGSIALGQYGETFVKRFPRTCHFLTSGKNAIELGRNFGNFLVVKKGNTVVLASPKFSYLEPSFRAVEALLGAERRHQR